MGYYLTLGIILGVSAGFSPGPLLTLVITETLEHGIGSGIKVAVAPLITDLPIIAFTFLLLTQLSGVNNVLGVISLVGGCYVLYMGFESLRLNGPDTSQVKTGSASLSRGVLTNALSPHPYLFWLSVGVPTVMKSLGASIVAPFLFMGGFYLFLVGSKMLLAILVGKSKSFMSENAYLYTMKFLGLLLVVFSVLLFTDALTLLGVIET